MLQARVHKRRGCALPSEMERDDAGWNAVASDGVRWIVMACAGEMRTESDATNATMITPAIDDAESRVSRLTTRFVNAFRTNPAPQLFQVVSGGRGRIGRHAFSTCHERNSSLAAANLRPEARMPSAHAAIKDAARRSAVPPAGRHPWQPLRCGLVGIYRPKVEDRFVLLRAVSGRRLHGRALA